MRKARCHFTHWNILIIYIGGRSIYQVFLSPTRRVYVSWKVCHEIEILMHWHSEESEYIQAVLLMQLSMLLRFPATQIAEAMKTFLPNLPARQVPREESLVHQLLNEPITNWQKNDVIKQGNWIVFAIANTHNADIFQQSAETDDRIDRKKFVSAEIWTCQLGKWAPWLNLSMDQCFHHPCCILLIQSSVIC